MRSRWKSAAGSILAILLVTAGCDGDTTGPAAEVIGSYTLREYRYLPLPYSETDTGESVVAGMLELRSNGSYERIRIAGTYPGAPRDTSTGIYLLRGERIALVGDEGDASSLEFSGGVLVGDGTAYVRNDLEVPPAYDWTLYRLVRCDTSRRPFCQALGGSLWLRDDGAYRTAEPGPGATSRWSGSYVTEGEAIQLVGMPSERSTGTLRNDTLTLGEWVWVREPGD